MVWQRVEAKLGHCLKILEEALDGIVIPRDSRRKSLVHDNHLVGSMMAQRWLRYDNLVDQFVNTARVASKQHDCEQ